MAQAKKLSQLDSNNVSDTLQLKEAVARKVQAYMVKNSTASATEITIEAMKALLD